MLLADLTWLSIHCPHQRSPRCRCQRHIPNSDLGPRATCPERAASNQSLLLTTRIYEGSIKARSGLPTAKWLLCSPMLSPGPVQKTPSIPLRATDLLRYLFHHLGRQLRAIRVELSPTLGTTLLLCLAPLPRAQALHGSSVQTRHQMYIGSTDPNWRMMAQPVDLCSPKKMTIQIPQVGVSHRDHCRHLYKPPAMSLRSGAG